MHALPDQRAGCCGNVRVEKAGSFYRNVLGARETFRKATQNGELVRLGPTSEQMTNPTFPMVRWKLTPNFETRLKKGHDNEEIADTCWSKDRSGVPRAG